MQDKQAALSSVYIGAHMASKEMVLAGQRESGRRRRFPVVCSIMLSRVLPYMFLDCCIMLSTFRSAKKGEPYSGPFFAAYFIICPPP
jgi:hypothetical protein